ncbi:MAG: glutamate-5-semialdehyde dehydrogenase [SAR202 cluster bacterium]|nr:glutamate-5-semialdehyde dehydrogenase [SAR202 cluster bacterium]
MTTTEIDLKALATDARSAARKLASATTAQKNDALHRIAIALGTDAAAVIKANEQDLAGARAAGLGDHVIDRLLLDRQRLAQMASDTRAVASLPDPIGEVIESNTLPNGIRLERRRVPLGVIGVIYESRPNVTIDISALCLKSGNAAILRGGREAFHSNQALATLVGSALAAAGLPRSAIQFVASTDRALVDQLLTMKDQIDLLIPRGGADLVRMVAEKATMPAITGGVGVCHTYVDDRADLDKAVAIVVNAKVQRPSVCNALDTIIVHSQIADRFLPAVARKLWDAGVELRCDPRSLAVLEPAARAAGKSDRIKRARSDDFGREFLALIAAVKVVDGFDDALDHIAKYGSGHSEAIVTESQAAEERFLNEVDAAAVFANASTRFTDGARFGLGAEVAISTGKFHARGPMGLREITSYKWVARGSGQIVS